MTSVNSHLSMTQSNGGDEVVSLKPCEVVLERLSPEHVKKVLRTQREEPDSDSGDSLFLTQKTVPQLVRSRRNRYKLPLEEDINDSSSLSSASDEPLEITTKKRVKRVKKPKLPLYRFSSLSKKETELIRKRNACIHDAGMAGFLIVVKEICEGEDVESSLSAKGTDEDGISPLTEEEDEGSETEDIKVVEKKLFAVQLKSKKQQTWGNHLQKKNITNAANAGREPSQEKQSQVSNKEPATTNTLRTAAEENELATTNGNSEQQPETQNTKSLLEGEQEEGETTCSEEKMTKSKCGTENTTLEVNGNIDTDFNVEVSGSECAENGSKKDRGAEDAEQLQSSTVNSETLNHDAKDQRKKKKRKKREEVITEEERREEGNSLAVSQETLESSFVKRKKKHLSCGDAAQEEEECTGVRSVTALSESEEKSAKERKKRNLEEVDNSLNPVENTNSEHVENTQNKADEDQISEKVTKRKKKKRRKRASCSENKSEQDSAKCNDSVSVQEEKRSSSVLGAGAESLQSVEVSVTGEENGRNVEKSKDGVKKKKKRKQRESCSENKSKQDSAKCNDSVPVQEEKRSSSVLGAGAKQSVEASFTGVEDDRNVEKSKDGVKRKKKRKQRESCSENKSKQDSAHCDDSVSVQEEKRSSSVLSADAESLQSVEASVTGAEKTSADAPGLEKDSAENDRNVEEFNDGVRKKKKKKKGKKRKVLEMQDGVEKDQEQANILQSASCEGDRPDVKRRRKQEGSELMTPAESLDSAVNAHLPLNGDKMVLKRKKKKRKDEIGEQEDDRNEKKKGCLQTAEENMISRGSSLSKSELLSSDRTKKNKHFKVKRSLYNPNEDFLSDL